MNRARSHDEKKSFVVTKDYAMDFLTGLENKLRLRVCPRNITKQLSRFRENPVFQDINIRSLVHGGGVSEWEGGLSRGKFGNFPEFLDLDCFSETALGFGQRKGGSPTPK